MAAGFVVQVDDDRELIEVTYPAHPTKEDIARYRIEIKRAISDIGRSWDCLVDQRPLTVMPPELVEEVSALNAYAEKHGMRRSARVVSSAVATLQSSRMARNASLHAEVKTFTSPEAAREWLIAMRSPTK
jgi:hypothetical protein